MDRNAPRHTFATNRFLDGANPGCARRIEPGAPDAMGAAEIINAVPESYLLGDREVRIDALLAAKGVLSGDGRPQGGADAPVREADEREAPEGLTA